MAITIAYDRHVKGWTSNYSFTQMNNGISLNNHFYTFQGGEIWRHNDESQPMNTFYGIYAPTEIVFLFNDDPSSVKNFKTISLEGDGQWDVKIQTDQESGSIDKVLFKTREGKQYAYIRGDDHQFETLDLKSAAAAGIGFFVNPLINDGEGTTEFSDLPDSLSVGDIIYRSTVTGETGGTPELIGRVSALDYSTNTLTVGDKTGIEQNTDGSLRQFYTPTSNDLAIYIKSDVAEKSGLLGFFATVTLTNESSGKAELFSVGSEVFTSS